jgi:phosphatidylinositol alpha-1,6-mannosyltransferase
MAARPRVMALTHSLSEVDGVGRYAVGTLRELAPGCDGIDVYIGLEHRGLSADVPRQGVTLHETLVTDGFPFMTLPKIVRLLAFGLPQLWRAARRADVVHSFADYPLGYVAVLVARMAGRPVVVSGHGTYSVTPTRMPFHRRLIAWMYKRADRFVTGSEYALRQVREVADPRSAEVVPYGCQPTDHDAAMAAGEEAGVPGPFVLCVGEVKQRKGYTISLPAFLRARGTAPELHFAIVGRYVEDDPYYQALLDQIREAGAQQHVHFLGNVSQARKVALMRGCQAFMLTPMTSDEGGFEAFGLVFLEAGASGRPVVGCTGSGAEDAITDGSNGFLRAPEDIDGLAGALVRLTHEPGLADEMGRAGRARAEGQSWAAAATRVLAIYTELIEARSR